MKRFLNFLAALGMIPVLLVEPSWAAAVLLNSSGRPAQIETRFSTEVLDARLVNGSGSLKPVEPAIQEISAAHVASSSAWHLPFTILANIPRWLAFSSVGIGPGGFDWLSKPSGKKLINLRTSSVEDIAHALEKIFKKHPQAKKVSKAEITRIAMRLQGHSLSEAAQDKSIQNFFRNKSIQTLHEAGFIDVRTKTEAIARPHGPDNDVELVTMDVVTKQPTARKILDGEFSYTHVLKAVREYLTANNHAMMRRHAEQALDVTIKSGEELQSSVGSVKSGTYHHIIRAKVALPNRDGVKGSFTLVVSRTQSANPITKDDFENLNYLYSLRDDVPKPYMLGKVKIQGDGQNSSILLFADEWLDGYRELHLRASENGDRFILTGDDEGHVTENLTDAESDETFRGIARIFGGYANNPRHAVIIGAAINAGDFVARRMPDGSLRVKLITVRKLVDHETSTTAILDQLTNALFPTYSDLSGEATDRRIYTRLLPGLQGFFEGIAQSFGSDSPETRRQAADAMQSFCSALLQRIDNENFWQPLTAQVGNPKRVNLLREAMMAQAPALRKIVWTEEGPSISTPEKSIERPVVHFLPAPELMEPEVVAAYAIPALEARRAAAVRDGQKPFLLIDGLFEQTSSADQLDGLQHLAHGLSEIKGHPVTVEQLLLGPDYSDARNNFFDLVERKPWRKYRSQMIDNLAKGKATEESPKGVQVIQRYAAEHHLDIEYVSPHIDSWRFNLLS